MLALDRSSGDIIAVNECDFFKIADAKDAKKKTKLNNSMRSLSE